MAVNCSKLGVVFTVEASLTSPILWSELLVGGNGLKAKLTFVQSLFLQTILVLLLVRFFFYFFLSTTMTQNRCELVASCPMLSCIVFMKAIEIPVLVDVLSPWHYLDA